MSKKEYKLPFFQGKANRLEGEDYYYFLLDKIRKAKKRILVVMFIIDPLDDPDKKVKNIFRGLANAVWKKLDVRVVIGSSKRSALIEVMDKSAVYNLSALNIPVRFGDPSDDYSLHSKYVIIDDDLVFLGSHNWADLAFSKSRQNSLAVKSRDTNIYFEKQFEKLWGTAKTMDYSGSTNIAELLSSNKAGL